MIISPSFICMIQQKSFLYTNEKQDIPDSIALDDGKGGKSVSSRSTTTNRLEEHLNSLASNHEASRNNQGEMVELHAQTVEALPTIIPGGLIFDIPFTSPPNITRPTVQQL